MENNYLSSKNVLDMRRELEEADKSGADKAGIYEKYANISKKNREEAVDKSCSGNPFCANGALQEAQGGSDIANSLNRLPAFSSLSNEDLAQLDRFVLAENEDSARAIYQAMPDYVKVALNGKEAVEALGLGAAIGGKSLAALGVIGKASKDKPNYTLNKEGAMLGINGPTVPSKTLWMGKGKERIDVENPAPGKRAGQIHYQDNSNNKYYYDPVTQTFPDAPKSVNDKLKDSTFKSAIDKGMTKYLGEK